MIDLYNTGDIIQCMTTILIASSNKNVREKVKAVLDLHRELYPITCECEFDEISERSDLLSFHFVIIDMIQDYKKGLILVRQIKKRFPEQKIIALTISKDQNLMIDAFRCGVDGYLINSGLFNELYRCVCTLLLGDKYVCNEIVNEILNHYINATDTELGKSSLVLSRKETDHIKLIANGYNSKEIAYKMSISGKTVNNYRIKIMKKLNINNIPELVKYAIREQLIEL